MTGDKKTFHLMTGYKKTTVLPLTFYLMKADKKRQCNPLCFNLTKNDSVTPYVLFDDGR